MRVGRGSVRGLFWGWGGKVKREVSGLLSLFLKWFFSPALYWI